MSWWMWVLLWTALVVLSVLFLAVALALTGRRAVLALRELDALGRALESIEPNARDLAARHDGLPRSPDIFTPWRDARHEFRDGKRRRQTARSERRIQRRARRGQPQRAKDLLAVRPKGTL